MSALWLVAACSGASPISLGVSDPGPVPELPADVMAAAEKTVGAMPEVAPVTEDAAQTDAAARAQVAQFADAAQRIVASPEPVEAGRCKQAAQGLARDVSPEDVRAAAHGVADPELSSLTYTARARVGSFLSRCADGAKVGPRDAQEAVALVRVRLGQVNEAVGQ